MAGGSRFVIAFLAGLMFLSSLPLATAQNEQPNLQIALDTKLDEIYLEGDEELIESQHTVEYHKAMCDHAEKMCKMLNNRGFQIKNAIDWKRFMEGSI